MSHRIATFRERLRSRQPLVGTFVKTPSPIACEVLATAGLDVLCLDAEHAPFGRAEIDACLAVLTARDQPALVRVASHSPDAIRDALDAGAAGILVPHVESRAQAEAIVRAAHYVPGGRGFSGSTRAAAFGAKTMAEHLEASRHRTTVIAQIEDRGALEQVEAIAAVEGVDGVFIGRADLAVALGHDFGSSEVEEAARRICTRGRAAKLSVGLFVPTLEEMAAWQGAGASWFLHASDQGLLLSGARRLLAAFRSAAR